MPMRDLRTTTSGDKMEANLKNVKQTSVSTIKLSEETNEKTNLNKHIRYINETERSYNKASHSFI